MKNVPADDFIEYDPHKHKSLPNINCVYCGRLFDGKIKKTKDHVIGENFVPKGVFEGQWILIINACIECNHIKSQLESDISAITMQPDVAGNHVNDDHLLKAEACRKAKGAISHKTGRSIADSSGNVDAVFSAPEFKITFGLSYPPQVDFERISRLAYFHVMAFFFMQTYDGTTKRGGFPLGSFYPVIHADKGDWGNDVMRWFMNEIADWDTRVYAVTANEYFKIKTKKSVNGVMAWAVEWNQKMRCIGFWGQPNDLEKIIARMPKLKIEHMGEDALNGLYMRGENPISLEDDVMFSVPNRE